jgi:hypothetical protein
MKQGNNSGQKASDLNDIGLKPTARQLNLVDLKQVMEWDQEKKKEYVQSHGKIWDYCLALRATAKPKTSLAENKSTKKKMIETSVEQKQQGIPRLPP